MGYPIFKKGDQVVYVSGRHGNTPSNPLWDRMSAPVIGTITKVIMSSGYCVNNYRVKWDNGTENGYYPGDLELHDEGPPLPVPYILDLLTI